MKKIGKFNVLEENICTLDCECGWNLKIGGEDKKDLKTIKEFLKGFGKERWLRVNQKVLDEFDNNKIVS